jgi:hypothetical protein
MVYYIIYPRNKVKNALIINHKPTRLEEKNYGGFAEGSFKTKKDAMRRIVELRGSTEIYPVSPNTIKKFRHELSEGDDILFH